MGIAEIIAFLKALPALVEALREVRDDIKQLRQDSIDRTLEGIKADVAETIRNIEGAKSNEDRKRLAMELALRMSK